MSSDFMIISCKEIKILNNIKKTNLSFSYFGSSQKLSVSSIKQQQQNKTQFIHNIKTISQISR